MNRSFATCRVCHECDPERDLVKYGVRHYVHPACALKRWSAAFFARIHPWQARNFPIIVAEQFGVSDALRARAAAE